MEKQNGHLQSDAIFVHSHIALSGDETPNATLVNRASGEIITNQIAKFWVGLIQNDVHPTILNEHAQVQSKYYF